MAPAQNNYSIVAPQLDLNSYKPGIKLPNLKAPTLNINFGGMN